MNIKAFGQGAVLAAALAVGAAWAAGQVTDDSGAGVVAKLKALRPDLPIESVSAGPLPGITVIELSGGTMLYATADGRHFFAGDLYEIRDDKLVNLAETRRDAYRKQLIDAVPRADMAIFPATGAKKSTITVFTDVDCGFCRKLHQDVPELNARGVEVRYLAYPRQGIGSGAYDKMVSAWCAADRNDAITRLKRGENIAEQHCDNPVARQYELGQQLGVSGTPAIVFESGRLQPGYTPAAELAREAME
jgi:thiol:disulfide interchange protein DsbC